MEPASRAIYTAPETPPATVREPSTVRRYRELLEAHVLPTLGGRQLKALQPLELQALYDQPLIAGRRDGTGGLHPRTVGHVHRVLHRRLSRRPAGSW
jgi:hypothetical protein